MDHELQLVLPRGDHPHQADQWLALAAGRPDPRRDLPLTAPGPAAAIRWLTLAPLLPQLLAYIRTSVQIPPGAVVGAPHWFGDHRKRQALRAVYLGAIHASWVAADPHMSIQEWSKLQNLVTHYFALRFRLSESNRTTREYPMTRRSSARTRPVLPDSLAGRVRYAVSRDHYVHDDIVQIAMPSVMTTVELSRYVGDPRPWTPRPLLPGLALHTVRDLEDWCALHNIETPSGPIYRAIFHEPNRHVENGILCVWLLDVMGDILGRLLLAIPSPDPSDTMSRARAQLQVGDAAGINPFEWGHGQHLVDLFLIIAALARRIYTLFSRQGSI